MLLRKVTCNWAHGKRRGFSPGAAARHRGLSRALVHPSSQGKWTMIALIVGKWTMIALIVHFPLEIGRLRRPIPKWTVTSPWDCHGALGDTKNKYIIREIGRRHQSSNCTSDVCFQCPISDRKCDLKSDVTSPKTRGPI